MDALRSWSGVRRSAGLRRIDERRQRRTGSAHCGAQWSSGFLPSRFQGVQFQSQGSPVLYLNRPDGVSADGQRRLVDTVNQLNRGFDNIVADPEIATRIQQYEMAFRMQTSVPGLMDLGGVSKQAKVAYGTEGGDGTFASNCLLARRLLERGVRFVQVYHRAWDHHGNIKKSMEITAKEVDQATAALINDLKQTGLYEDTLIVWGGEFGRTPMAQGTGRDHHIKGFSLVLSGGAIRGGLSYGSTDDFGYAAVENQFTSATFTPRYCTCSVSITDASPTAFKDWISG